MRLAHVSPYSKQFAHRYAAPHASPLRGDACTDKPTSQQKPNRLPLRVNGAGRGATRRRRTAPVFASTTTSRTLPCGRTGATGWRVCGRLLAGAHRPPGPNRNDCRARKSAAWPAKIAHGFNEFFAAHDPLNRDFSPGRPRLAPNGARKSVIRAGGGGRAFVGRLSMRFAPAGAIDGPPSHVMNCTHERSRHERPERPSRRGR